MSQLIQPDSSHWYTKDGEPFFECKAKDGSLRRTTLADARKVGALPSVTNVLRGSMARPALEAWKVEQAILASLTLPKEPGEPLESFAQRVVADMDFESQKAADFGSMIHRSCAGYATTGEIPEDSVVGAYIADWREWYDQCVSNVFCVERSFASRALGYGGTIDLVAEVSGSPCVVDFKTQRVRRLKDGTPRPTFYDEWPLQLAAYRRLTDGKYGSPNFPPVSIVSVIIDSSEPGPIHIKTWTEADQPEIGYSRLWDCAYNLWSYLNSYDPRQRQ